MAASTDTHTAAGRRTVIGRDRPHVEPFAGGAWSAGWRQSVTLTLCRSVQATHGRAVQRAGHRISNLPEPNRMDPAGRHTWRHYSATEPSALSCQAWPGSQPWPARAQRRLRLPPLPPPNLSPSTSFRLPSIVTLVTLLPPEVGLRSRSSRYHPPALLDNCTARPSDRDDHFEPTLRCSGVSPHSPDAFTGTEPSAGSSLTSSSPVIVIRAPPRLL